MAILWSSLIDGQSIAFGPTDSLEFNIPGSSASQVLMSYPSGSSVILSYAGRSVTLLTSPYSLVFDNFIFSDGSRLVFGNGANDSLAGNDDAGNTLSGTAGNDLLDGGLGNDTMTGGAGNDVYVTDSFFDVVVENPGEGNDQVRTSASAYTLSANIENLRMTRGDVSFDGTGNSLNNIITGNNSNDSINGAGGADIMAGGLGDDRYAVDDPGDMVLELANSGFDSVVSTISYDLMAAWHVEGLSLAGAADINGSGNRLDNYIQGNSGANLLSGSIGNDTLSGGGVATDTLAGGVGNDVYLFEDTAFGDFIIESAGQGSDKLVLNFEGPPQVLNLAGVAGVTMSSVETIDLFGNGNTLTLNAADIAALAPDGAMLRVDGTSADSVDGGGGWFLDGVVNSGGQNYDRFSQGAVTLQVDEDVLRYNFTFSINLSALNGSNGFEINGEAVNNLSGQAVSAAGDFNGDGYADLLIGAYNRSPGGLESAGSSYVVFGGASGFSANLNLSALNGANGFEITGETAFDWSGKAVSGAGDINGDGYADLLIGAGVRDAGGTNAGAAYVLFGKASGLSSNLALSALDGSNGFEINGEQAFDVAGVSVSGAGDVNGDGYADLLVGAFGRDINGSAAGASYVVFGKATGFSANLDLSALDGSNGFEINGEASNDRSGYSVAAAGDVNGDGYADILIGASLRDTGVTDGGAAYVVFGKAAGFAANLNLSTLDGSNGFEILGQFTNDQLGGSVTGVGDFNGDGFSDIAVGAKRRDVYGSESGSTYVLYGKASGFAADFDPSLLNGTNGFQLSGEAAGDQSGSWVSGAGDINGDGYADLLIGAPLRDGSGADAGGSYVVFGGLPSGFGGNITLSSLLFGSFYGIAINGEAAGDLAGRSVAGAGDVNGDGYDDLLIGADGRDVNGTSAGASYVLFGRDYRQEVDFRGGSGNDAHTGTASGEILIGGLGSDTLDGGGGADVIKGAAGNDMIFFDGVDFRVDGGSGYDTLVMTGSGVNLNLTAAAEAKFSGFERIDLTGSGANSLTIDVAGLFALSDATRPLNGPVGSLSSTSGKHMLQVDGDAGDTFIATGNGWVYQGNRGFPGDGTSYSVYTQGAAVLVVNDFLNSNIGTLSVPLSSLNGANGFQILGELTNDQMGRAVSDAGDINGDGYADLLIGAELRDINGAEAGAAYVVFGKASSFGAMINVSTLDGSNGFELNGVATSDFTGRSVSAAGDVNGDGFGDLLIGADGRNQALVENVGASYVVFGQASGFAPNLNLSALNGSNGFAVLGEALNNKSGFSVSDAGDVNGDGYADLLIGAYARASSTGSSYVVFGKASGFSATVNLSTLSATDGFEITGGYAGEQSGRSVAGAGDVNGDGFDDLLIGAYANPTNGILAGASYVVFGKASGFGTTLSLSSLTGGDGFKINGAETFEFFGRSVSAAGDVNGDGFADLLIGAQGATGTSYAGASYVVFGKASGYSPVLEVSALNGSNGFKISGQANDDRSGFSVSGAGDINGDGYDDVLIGAYGRDVNGTNAGASYVVFGGASGFAANLDLSTLNGWNGFQINGEAAFDYSSRSVSGAGDVNGDGFDDLIISGALNDDGGPTAGASYVIYGRDFRGDVDVLGGDGNDSLIGTIPTDVLVGGQGNDTLDGGGAGEDVLKGGAGDDVLIWAVNVRQFDGGAGHDTVWFEHSVSLLQPEIDSRFSGIEAFDLSGAYNNTLTVTLADVLSLSDTSNTLRVLGNADDTLVSTGQGWVAGSDVTLGSNLYHSYTSGAGTLLVDADMIQTVS